ncbi:hypothetical protein PG984_003347 [Apiospora sp. TS-2023a]
MSSWPGCDALKLVRNHEILGCCQTPTRKCTAVGGLDLNRCVGIDRWTGDLAKKPSGMFSWDCQKCSLIDGRKLECECKGKLTSLDLARAEVLEVDMFGTLKCSDSYV